MMLSATQRECLTTNGYFIRLCSAKSLNIFALNVYVAALSQRIMGEAYLTERKKTFVEHLLRGMSGQEAAVAAGYSPKDARKRAWTLQNRDESVMALIEERRKEIQEDTLLTVDRLAMQLQIDHDLAVEKGQLNAAVKATEQLCRLGGHFVEKIEAKHIEAGWERIRQARKAQAIEGQASEVTADAA